MKIKFEEEWKLPTSTHTGQYDTVYETIAYFWRKRKITTFDLNLRWSWTKWCICHWRRELKRRCYWYSLVFRARNYSFLTVYVLRPLAPSIWLWNILPELQSLRRRQSQCGRSWKRRLCKQEWECKPFVLLNLQLKSHSIAIKFDNWYMSFDFMYYPIRW